MVNKTIDYRRIFLYLDSVPGIQKEIFSRIKKEQQLVDANKKLIGIERSSGRGDRDDRRTHRGRKREAEVQRAGKTVRRAAHLCGAHAGSGTRSECPVTG